MHFFHLRLALLQLLRYEPQIQAEKVAVGVLTVKENTEKKHQKTKTIGGGGERTKKKEMNQNIKKIL